MVALAILAIAMAAVINGVSAHTNNAAYLRDRTLAHWVAMNRAVEVQVGDQWPSTGVTKGRAEMADRNRRWETKVITTGDAGVRRVDIDVRAEGGEEPLASVIAYAGKPL